jgi:hypothetical protein
MPSNVWRWLNMPKATLFVHGEDGAEHVDARLREFRDTARRCGSFVDQEVVWFRDDNALMESLQALKRGDCIFTDTLELFGGTQEDVAMVLEYIIFGRGIKVYVPTGFGIIEITDEALEIALYFGRIDVKLCNQATA